MGHEKRGGVQKPRRRLRHLQRIQVRNLRGSFTSQDIPNISSYIVIWSRLVENPPELPWPPASPSRGSDQNACPTSEEESPALSSAVQIHVEHATCTSPGSPVDPAPDSASAEGATAEPSETRNGEENAPCHSVKDVPDVVVGGEACRGRGPSAGTGLRLEPHGDERDQTPVSREEPSGYCGTVMNGAGNLPGEGVTGCTRGDDDSKEAESGSEGRGPTCQQSPGGAGTDGAGMGPQAPAGTGCSCCEAGGGPPWQPVYISRPEAGTIAPEFGPLNLPDDDPRPSPFLHHFQSGLIHIHLYVLPTSDVPLNLRDIPLPRHPPVLCGHPFAPQDLPEPRDPITVGPSEVATRLPGDQQQPDAAEAIPSDERGVEGTPSAEPTASVGTDTGDRTGGGPRDTAEDPAREPPGGTGTLPHTGDRGSRMLEHPGDSGSEGRDQREMREQRRVLEECRKVPGLPGELVLAASLDLEALQQLAGEALPAWLPHNALLLEMDGGWRLFPALPPHYLPVLAPAPPASGWQDRRERGDDAVDLAENGSPEPAGEVPQRGGWPGAGGREGGEGSQAAPASEGPSTSAAGARVGLFTRVLTGRSVPRLAGRSPSHAPRSGTPAPESSGRATPSEGEGSALDPEDLLQRLTEAWETAPPARGTATPQRQPRVEEASRVQRGLLSLLEEEESLRNARSRRDSALSRLNQMLEERKVAREQRSQLNSTRQRVAWLGQREQRAVQGAARARRAASFSLSILLTQARALDSALATMQAAGGRLKEAEERLEREARRGTLRSVVRKIITRRCVLASALADIYDIGPRTITEAEAPEGGFPWDQLDRMWTGEAGEPVNGVHVSANHVEGPRGDASSARCSVEGGASDADSAGPSSSSGAPPSPGTVTSINTRLREVAVLSMGGLQLEPLLWRRGAEGFLAADGDPTEGRRLAAALGYVAHCLVALEQYLDVPLRYPIHAAASHSVVFDYSPPAGTYRLLEYGATRKAADTGFIHLLQLRAGDDEGLGTCTPSHFPLYFEGGDATRFAYAVYLLNKDVEQLLDVHGLLLAGPGQLLQNLYKLLAAAKSGLPHLPPPQGS